MNRWLLLYILLLADWTSGIGEGVYDPNRDYELMDDFFETRHRGGLELPPCVKDLMNCWEVINPDRMCKINNDKSNYQFRDLVVPLDTICMDLRFQCREYMGYAPFPKDRNIEELFIYCFGAKWGAENPKMGEWGLDHMRKP